MAVKIYHNPRCTKSRQTLQLLKDNNINPEVILYLENPLEKSEIHNILNLLGASVQDIMRKKETEYKEQNLKDVDDTNLLIEAIVKTPKLLERPIVVVDNQKAAIGRPPENILGII